MQEQLLGIGHLSFAGRIEREKYGCLKKSVFGFEVIDVSRKDVGKFFHD